MLVSKIISGGQTGADRGGLDAAMELGLAHGGHCPRGRLAEDGSVPSIYQLVETPDNDYRTRTKLNVDNADVTLIFTMGSLDGGSLFTQKYCDEHKRPWAHLSFGLLWSPDGSDLVKHARWLRDRLQKTSEKLGRPLIVNVAGNRESKSPGIQERTARLLYIALEENGHLESVEDQLIEEDKL
jgi:hypothetical protein